MKRHSLWGGVVVDPLEITHGKLTIAGYKINNSAYITDCSDIPLSTQKKLFGLDLMIINALGFAPTPRTSIWIRLLTLLKR